MGFNTTIDGKLHGAGGYSWSLNQWYHIVGIYDYSHVKLIINGKLIASSRFIKGALSCYSTDIYIGRHVNLSRPRDHLPGLIDDVRIYNRALTESEIQQLYSRKIYSPVSGCINMKGFPVKKGTAMLIQSGEFHQKVPLDINGCYKFDRVVEERPFSVMIRRNTE